MKAKLIMNEKEYEVDVTEQQIKEIEKTSKKRWRAHKGDIYWHAGTDGKTYVSFEYYREYDDFNYLIGNYFKTEEEAKEHKKKLIYQQQYRDYVNEHNKCEFDWKNQHQFKYYAYYNNLSCIEISYAFLFKHQGVIYATSRQIIEDFIKEIGEDNFKKYILEVE